MVEHRTAVDLFRFLLIGSASEAGSIDDVSMDDGSNNDGSIESAGTSTASETGTAMTLAGPAPYAGAILDKPDVLWMDDHWTATEEEEALRIIAEKGPPVKTFWREKYERESRRSWNNFYRRNTNNFFKDRHYLCKVFPDLGETDGDREIVEMLKGRSDGAETGRLGRRTLLELGCGVGNAVFPLLEENAGLYVIAVDLASTGIKLLKEHPMYSCGRCEALVLDATTDELPPSVLESGGVDLVLLQFSISAVAPKDMARVARLVEQALRPGGKLLLRDYGRHDEAQLRFAKGRRLGDNVYVRQDGTTSYFFSLEDVRQLFCCGSSSQDDSVAFSGGSSLVEEELFYVRRQYANRGQRVARRRVWVHGIFQKPTG